MRIIVSNIDGEWKQKIRWTNLMKNLNIGTMQIINGERKQQGIYI